MNFVIQSTFEKSNSLNWTIGLSSIFFTLLFHQAGIGLNLSVFTMLIMAYWLVRFGKVFTNWDVSSLALLCFTSAVANTWFGTADTILWCILSLLLLGQKVYYPKSSLLLSETKAVLNLFMAPFGALSRMLEQKTDEAPHQTKFVRVLLFVVLPISFTAFFANIYKNMNPIFEEAYNSLVSQLDIYLILTVLLGLVISYILLKPEIPDQILKTDRWAPDSFRTPARKLTSSEVLERQVGVVLFAILNLTLFIFLVSDVFFLQEIASGTAENYAGYVHQGVGLLIFSILIASAFIFYFFRSAATALLPGNDWLKRLAIIWMVLNIGILITTGFKNFYYVEGYSLTLKRIGVFVYLSLAVSGLAITLLKVIWGKTNFFILRNLYWAFLLILGVNNCLDWSRFITHYNIDSHLTTEESLDWSYLFTLDERVLPVIYEHKNEIRFGSEHAEAAFNEKLGKELSSLYHYNPEWREISFAKQQAQSQLWGK